MKINPCPFCGGDAELVVNNGYYHVECSQCGAYTLSKYLKTEKGLSEENIAAAAIKKWNAKDEIIGVNN